MTVSANSAIANAAGTGSTTVALQITGVPAGATLLAGVLNRSNQTAVISSISDSVNGSWTPDYVNGGPQNVGASNRCWLAYLTNVSAGDPTVTVTFDSAINSQLALAWIDSDQGAMTFEGSATVSTGTVGATTQISTNTYSASAAGAIVGFIASNNAHSAPEPSADGSNESRLTTNTGNRAFLFFEPYTGAGTYGFTTTIDAATYAYLVGAFLEPSSATAARMAAFYRMLRNA